MMNTSFTILLTTVSILPRSTNPWRLNLVDAARSAYPGRTNLIDTIRRTALTSKWSRQIVIIKIKKIFKSKKSRQRTSRVKKSWWRTSRVKKIRRMTNRGKKSQWMTSRTKKSESQKLLKIIPIMRFRRLRQRPMREITRQKSLNSY